MNVEKKLLEIQKEGIKCARAILGIINFLASLEEEQKKEIEKIGILDLLLNIHEDWMQLRYQIEERIKNMKEKVTLAKRS